jgi:hypothetical protein
LSENTSSGEFQETPESNPHAIRKLSNVICKSGLILIEGTLILTGKELSLINAKPFRGRVDASSPGDENKPSAKGSEQNNDEQSKEQNAQPAISIPLKSIQSLTYETPRGRSSSLVVKWLDERSSLGRTKKSEFIPRLELEAKEKKLGTWIPIIDEAKNAGITLERSDSEGEEETQESIPNPEQLESKILDLLDQKEWKGSFQIAAELREKFHSKYDFDQVETVCKRLAQKKLVAEDKIGGFFRKA